MTPLELCSRYREAALRHNDLVMRGLSHCRIYGTAVVLIYADTQAVYPMMTIREMGIRFSMDPIEYPTEGEVVLVGVVGTSCLWDLFPCLEDEVIETLRDTKPGTYLIAAFQRNAQVFQF